MANLSSYNSDFLSGIFADVAKANVLSELDIPQKRGSDLIASDSSDESSDDTSVSPKKKSRTSLKGSCRARSSTMNLTELAEIQSPKGINEFFGTPSAIQSKTPKVSKSLSKSHHHDSLAFQLNCVAEDGPTTSHATTSTSHATTVGDAAKIAFPNLPATVSDSSCSAGLTRATLVRHVTTPENEPKESFGWFVDLDDNDDEQTVEATSSLPYTVSSDDLAFQARPAPKRVNDDAEVEWAKAADTVDDVLGDFF
jgi:hypothetical protein